MFHSQVVYGGALADEKMGGWEDGRIGGGEVGRFREVKDLDLVFTGQT